MRVSRASDLPVQPDPSNFEQLEIITKGLLF